MITAVANLEIRPIAKRPFFFAVLILIGLTYGLLMDPMSLAKFMTPHGLDPVIGYTAICCLFAFVSWVGYRIYNFLRHPLIAQAYHDGLFLKGVGTVEWFKVRKIWFGDPFSTDPRTLGNCLYVELHDPNLNDKLFQLQRYGFIAEKAERIGFDIRLRYWIPFVFPSQKLHFREVISQYGRDLLKK